MNDQLIEELLSLLAQIVGQDVEDVQPEDDLVASLGIDSLTGLRYLAVVEKTYGFRFPDHDLPKFRTLARVHDFVIANKDGVVA